MRKSLDTEAEYQLKVRVHIASSTHVFSRADIAKGFGISINTLNRYISPEYRAYHTKYAYELTQKKKVENKHACYRCAEPLIDHHRCADCTILLHVSDVRCDSCLRLHRYKFPI